TPSCAVSEHTLRVSQRRIPSRQVSCPFSKRRLRRAGGRGAVGTPRPFSCTDAAIKHRDHRSRATKGFVILSGVQRSRRISNCLRLFFEEKSRIFIHVIRTA